MVATKLSIALWLFSRDGLPLTVESFFNSSPSWFSAWDWQCTQFPCWLSALSGCSVHSTQFPASQNAKALSLPFSLFIILHGIVKLSGSWSSGFDVFSIKCDWFVVIWLAPSGALHYEHFSQCTMGLSIALELSKDLKSKCLVFAQFWSKYDNSSSDW